MSRSLRKREGLGFFGVFRHQKVALVLNGSLLTIFLGLGLYAKIGGGLRGHWVKSLFADFFAGSFPLYGVFTSAADVMWSFAASICWLTYAHTSSLRLGMRYQRFMLCSAILLSIFLLDDVFRLTLVLKIYLGVPKLIPYLIYGLLVIGYGFIYRNLLSSTPYGLLLVSVMLLIISGVSDMVALPGKGTPAFLEDGTKLLALLNICIYFWIICRRSVPKQYSELGG